MRHSAKITTIMALVLLLCGCRTQKAVEWRTVTDTVRVASTDTVRLTDFRYKVDSVRVRDTVKVYLEGGTKVVERTKWVDRWRIDSTGISELRVRCDSLSRAKADTKVVEKPVEVNVLRWWQRLLMGIGGIALTGAAAFLGIRYLRK